MTSPPRPSLRRTLYAILILALFLGVPPLLGYAIPGVAGEIAPTLAVLVAAAVIAPRVSYRWFDCFLLLIPFAGLIVLWRFVWRLAYLPDRDWPPRPDETPVPGQPATRRS